MPRIVLTKPQALVAQVFQTAIGEMTQSGEVGYGDVIVGLECVRYETLKRIEAHMRQATANQPKIVVPTVAVQARKPC